MYIYIDVCICMMDTQRQFSLFCLSEQLLVPCFESGGSEKMTVCGNLKSFCHAEYLPRGAYYFFCQKKKKTFKDKMSLSSQFQMLISACCSQTIS